MEIVLRVLENKMVAFDIIENEVMKFIKITDIVNILK